jgi:hypothetical protein
MAYEFKFPDVGEGITEGELLSWKVKEGDQVAVSLDVMTDAQRNPGEGQLALWFEGFTSGLGQDYRVTVPVKATPLAWTPVSYSFTVPTDAVGSNYEFAIAGTGGSWNEAAVSNIQVNVTSAPAPEPSALVLSGIALLGLLAYAWRKRR